MIMRLTFFLSMAIMGGALFSYAVFFEPGAWLKPLGFMIQIVFFSVMFAREIEKRILGDGQAPSETP